MTQLKTIPVVGEVFLGDEPAPVKAIKVTVGFATTDDVTLLTTTVSEVVDLLSVAAGVRILDMWVDVTTAFTAAVAITIGDSDSADGFFTSAMIGPTVSGLMKAHLAGDTSASRAMGFVYAAAQVIQAAVTKAGSAASDGALSLVVMYIDRLDN